MTFQPSRPTNMSEPEMMLTSSLKSKEVLHQRLRYLSEAIQRQLQETERRHKEQLESRIHHNTLLSQDVNKLPLQTKLLELSAPVLESSSECKQHSTRSPARSQQCERAVSCKTTQQKKEEEAEAECKKKFSALPVPNQVRLPLYREMIERRDEERKQGLEQRKRFLLSVQKPFSFQEREKKKQEKLVGLLNQASQEAKKKTVKTVQQSSPKEVKEPAERTRMEKLGFLDEKPSFQPKINHQVPDFNRLHKALQTQVLKTSLSRDLTKCQPFYLRTSALPARQSKSSPENSQILSQSNLSRSKSCGALKSLSADTLPTYITDATRQRCMAIRKSMEIRDGKNQESADWQRKYQSKSEAMRKTVSLHAKLLDPHKSLKEVYDERVRHHREADRQRASDYLRDLQDMKARVRKRPLLFEQVKQRHAKAQAEQVYKNELRKVGVEEQFVEEKAGTVTELSRSKGDTSPDVHNNYCSLTEEENVDGGGEN
ncbi:protein FAM161B isoform X3 [Hippocampus comes]|uniref:protein FAM161B isoform X3 n=1 Tax=Hippocampus comes TaxID=109280 RepID=UPI00094EDCD4|nr:PREDICTED: protein FAM161B isoform X3 [Hippocampus comes]